MSSERLWRITVEPGKCGGRPCIRGFRIRVSDVLELLAADASFEEILAEYPFLEREDILAAIEYAAGSPITPYCKLVKFLVDNQLPLALCHFITAQGCDCQHVLDVGLAHASDLVIWELCQCRKDRVIVSKDEDFFHLA